MISHSYGGRGPSYMVTSIGKLVTYPIFGNDSNYIGFPGMATVSKTKTISKVRRVPVMSISHHSHKNPSTLLKHCSAYA